MQGHPCGSGLVGGGHTGRRALLRSVDNAAFCCRLPRFIPPRLTSPHPCITGTSQVAVHHGVGAMRCIGRHGGTPAPAGGWASALLGVHGCYCIAWAWRVWLGRDVRG